MKRLLCLLIVSVVTACSEAQSTSPQNNDSLYLDHFPAQVARISGTVLDPEAFYFSMFTFPPPTPPEESPPPAFFPEIPYLVRATIEGATVETFNGATRVGEEGVSQPGGSYSVASVPMSDETIYHVQARPPADGVNIGGDFPNPPFAPIPVGQYVPTRTLRPILANHSSCHFAMSLLVGDAGALGAVAKHRTAAGTPTTVSDLVEGNDLIGGVVLVYVHAPSYFLDFFAIPGEGMRLAASLGAVYGIGWAPPGEGPPEQSAMGYFADAEPTSPLGYFAVVLPRAPAGQTQEVVLTPTDPVIDQNQGRPFLTEPVNISAERGVSILRIQTQRPEGEPEDPDSDPPRETDLGWLCDPRFAGH